MRYTATARVLHWLTVALVLLQVVLGVWMTAFEPKDEALKYRLYDIHENSGFILFWLTLFRLGWRATHTPPPLPADLAPLLKAAAGASHAMLYLLLLWQGVFGFLATNAWGFPFRFLGVLPIPSPVGKDEALAPVFSALHEGGAWALLALVALHASAACWHQWVRRDGTLEKML